jgi:hypothetical protein
VEEKCPKCGSTDLREQSVVKASGVLVRRVLDCLEPDCGGWLEIRYDQMHHVIHEVREYAEGKPVEINQNYQNGGRITVDATNEGGFNGTSIDLEDLLAWVSKEMPDLYKRFAPKE